MNEISGFWSVFGLGVFGGVAVEVLRWWKLRESRNLPEYANSLFYWGVTLAMFLLGGLLASMYGFEGRNPVTVVHLGASAPALINALASQTKSPDRSGALGLERGPEEAATRGRPSLRAFLSFRG